MLTEADKRNLDVARRFYSAEPELAADDIVWHVPGHNPVSGIYRGRDEYFDLMLSRMAPLTTWEFDLRDAMVNGEFIVATFGLRGERKQKTVELDGAHLLRINAKGQVAEGWGFTNRQDELDEFFSA